MEPKREESFQFHRPSIWKIYFQISKNQFPTHPRNKSLNKNNTNPRINFHEEGGLFAIENSLSLSRHRRISTTRKEGFKRRVSRYEARQPIGNRMDEEIRHVTLPDRDQFLETSRGGTRVSGRSHGWRMAGLIIPRGGGGKVDAAAMLRVARSIDWTADNVARVSN